LATAHVAHRLVALESRVAEVERLAELEAPAT
jgi:hypothetical protein